MIKNFFKIKKKDQIFKLELKFFNNNFKDLNENYINLIDLGSDLIINEIKKNKWENSSIYYWIKLIKLFKFKNIIDLGCYNGIYALIAINIIKTKFSGTKIYAIEPNPFIFSRTLINFDLNQYPSHHIIWAAITDSNNNKVNLNIPRNEKILTTASNIKENNNQHNIDNIILEVPNLKIDNFIKNIDSGLLIKIDIEGMEYPILSCLFNKYKHSSLVCLVEILNKSNFDKIVESAKLNKFSIFSIDEENKIIGKYMQYNSNNSNRNYLIFSEKANSIYQKL